MDVGENDEDQLARQFSNNEFLVEVGKNDIWFSGQHKEKIDCRLY